jgi:vacuolar-type H+-ATPase subunit I/STV1
LNQKVLELEANLNDLNEVQQKKSESDVATNSEIRKRLTEQVDRCRQLEAELQKRQQAEEELENKLQVSVITWIFL